MRDADHVCVVDRPKSLRVQTEKELNSGVFVRLSEKKEARVSMREGTSYDEKCDSSLTSLTIGLQEAEISPRRINFSPETHLTPQHRVMR